MHIRSYRSRYLTKIVCMIIYNVHIIMHVCVSLAVMLSARKNAINYVYDIFLIISLIHFSKKRIHMYMKLRKIVKCESFYQGEGRTGETKICCLSRIPERLERDKTCSDQVQHNVSQHSSCFQRWSGIVKIAALIGRSIFRD